MVSQLGGPAASGTPVTGVEPSCLLTLKDDYPALLPGDKRAAQVAAAVRLPEQLLLDAAADGWAPRWLAGGGERIVLHGHCHQKAVTGTAATVDLLRAIPGAAVAEVDAGCCGMAGSFGFEAEHYELSMQIGGQRLFPAILNEPDGTILAATGVSCRQQIAHGTARRARHPLEILRQSIAP
jgi:Fe-S oxidoreductase